MEREKVESEDVRATSNVKGTDDQKAEYIKHSMVANKRMDHVRRTTGY